MLNETTHDHDSDPPPPSGPMPGRLTMEERVRRSEMLEKATRQRDAHALDKAAWTKGWKRKDEYLAELIARLTREAGTGIDEGRQLSIPETEDTVAPTEAKPVDEKTKATIRSMFAAAKAAKGRARAPEPEPIDDTPF